MKMYKPVLHGALSLLWLVGTPQLLASSLTFPYASTTYSCRCLALNDGSKNIHRGLCELRTHIRALQPHISFMTEMIGNELVASTASWFEHATRTLSADIAHRAEKLENSDEVLRLRSLLDTFSWLVATKKTITTQKDSLKTEVATALAQFPFIPISGKLHSETLQHAVATLGTTKLYGEFISCWDALVKFTDSDLHDEITFQQVFSRDIVAQDPSLTTQEQCIRCAFIAVKDLTDITYLFHFFLIRSCALSFTGKDEQTAFAGIFDDPNRGAFIDILQMLAMMDDLPVEKTLEAMTRFVRRFSDIITKIQAAADHGFVGWLRSKWVFIPFTIGVIIIKTIQYFVIKDSMDGVGYSSYGGYF
ncbi:MAG: hypothetical protein WC365_07900 [Candidatus Babeliales bacterium]|jgi:hypothetical protein